MDAVADEAMIHGLEVSCDLIHSSSVNAIDAAQMGISWFEHASGFIQSLFPNWHTQADQPEWDKVNWDNPDMETIYALCKTMKEYEVKLCPTLIVTDQIEMFPNYWD